MKSRLFILGMLLFMGCFTKSYAVCTNFNVTIQKLSDGNLLNDVTLKANVTGGSSAIKYQWFPAGSTQTVTGRTTGTNYVIVFDTLNNCRDTAYLYVVDSTNCGNYSSAISITTNTSSSFTLSSTQTGNNVLNIYWLKAGVLIPGATSSTYTKQSPTAADYGEYCVIYKRSDSCVTQSCLLIADTSCKLKAMFNASVSTYRNVTLYDSSQLNNNSVVVTVKWGDGLSNTYTSMTSAKTHTYSANGVYNVCYKITKVNSSCADSICKSVTVNLCNIVLSTIKSNATSSNNGSITASASGGIPPYSYSWTTGATTSSIQNLTVGAYAVTVTDSLGCTKVKWDTLTNGNSSWITCSAYRDFTKSISGLTGDFTAASVPAPYYASYTWKFSDGTTQNGRIVTKTFSTSGSYTAKLIICITDSLQSLVCCDSTYQNFTVTSGSLSCANYKTFTKNISGLSGSFTASAVTSPYYASYTWKFSDGTTQNGRIVSKTFSTSGSYTAKLIICITDSLQSLVCCDSSYQIFTVSSGSLSCANYKTFTKNISGLSGSFTASAVPSPYNASYTWKFSDGTTQNGRIVTKTFSTSGSYTAKLKICITDSMQILICCDSSDQVFTVGTTSACTAVAKIGIVSNTNGTVTFIDSSVTSSAAVTYLWTFGDGTTSSAKNPVKLYNTNGTYTVKLKIMVYASGTNSVACMDSTTKVVVVNSTNPCNKLIAYFNYTMSGTTVNFTNASQAPGMAITSISWVFGDGTTSSSFNPSKVYNIAGTYNVNQVVTAYDSATQTTCTKSFSKVVTISSNPCLYFDARFTFVKTNFTVNFTNTTLGATSASTYKWRFGNGDSSSVASPSYSYSNPGYYRVVLYAANPNGSSFCKDSFVTYIRITTANTCKDSGFVNNVVNCQSYVAPVCGCDSMTYTNSCIAYYSGVKQYTYGPCPNDTHYVTICGYVYNDLNKNCAKDSFDLSVNYAKIKLNTTPPTYAYTNNQGYYKFVVVKGTYNVSQVMPHMSYPYLNQMCPTSGISVSATTGGQTYCNNNFYDTANTCPDLAVTINRIANITPGFTSMKRITYSNNGAIAKQNVKVHYRFANYLTVKSTTTPAYTVSGNELIWNIGTMAPYSSGTKMAYFTTPVTGVVIGSAVIDSVWIEPDTNDCNLANNFKTFNDTVTGSWDPNDKAVTPQGYTDTSVRALDYLVRFQNTGNAPAYNVVISDPIDANIDPASIQLVASSHSCNMYYNDDQKLYFEFENIMLPDSGTDYDASQGYVQFRANLKKNLPIGTVLKNTAYIYFDFNEAVVTNTVSNVISVRGSSSIDPIAKVQSLSVYPNPTKDLLNINLSKEMKKAQVLIYSADGRLVREEAYNKTIQVKDLVNGLYLIQVMNDTEVYQGKFIKE